MMIHLFMKKEFAEFFKSEETIFLIYKVYIKKQ